MADFDKEGLRKLAEDIRQDCVVKVLRIIHLEPDDGYKRFFYLSQETAAKINNNQSFGKFGGVSELAVRPDESEAASQIKTVLNARMKYKRELVEHERHMTTKYEYPKGVFSNYVTIMIDPCRPADEQRRFYVLFTDKRDISYAGNTERCCGC